MAAAFGIASTGRKARLGSERQNLGWLTCPRTRIAGLIRRLLSTIGNLLPVLVLAGWIWPKLLAWPQLANVE